MASDDLGMGLDATRLAVRTLYEHLCKGRDLASAMRDVLGGSGAGSGVRGLAAEVCHAAVSRKDRLSSTLRATGAGDPEREWAPLLLAAAAIRWGPSLPAAARGGWSARADLEKIGLEVGLPAAELRRKLDRIESAAFPLVISLASGAGDDAGALAAQASFPRNLVAVLLSSFGASATRNLLSYLNEPAPVYLRVAGVGAMETTIERLAAEGLAAHPTGRVPGALVLGSGDPRRGAALASAQVEIQDEASQLVARLAAAGPGGRVLDYCAGTGGKSLALASEPGAEVVVHDSDARRLDALDKRAARRGARFARLDPAGTEQFDVVLLDAPCTGLGAARRNPQVRWSQGPEDVTRHAHTQRQILLEAAARVRPGGLMVYAVCTFTSPETVETVSGLADGHVDLVPVSPPEWALPFLVQSGDGFSTFPKLWGADVFFVAILRRAGDPIERG